MSSLPRILAPLLVVAAHAFAQPMPPPLPTRDDAPPPPPVSIEPTTQPVSTEPTRPVERPYKLGPRLGGSTGLGLWVPGPMLSWQIFDLHGGVQVSPLFGAYLRVGYNASLGLGIGVNSMGASVMASGAGMWILGANAELALGDSFFLAAGPQVGVGTWFRGRVTGNTQGGSVQAIYSSGAHPGADVRLGLALGQADKVTKRRTQATIAFDLSFLYASNVYEGAVAAGTQGVSVALNFNEALAVVPTLQLGFEWR